MTPEERARETVTAYTASPIRAIRSLGGGFYGRAFLVDLDPPLARLVAKVSLYPTLARKEALQLKTLASHGKAKMPKVYFVSDDALLMEYLPGKNAGLVKDIPAPLCACVAEEIVENLISYHNVRHPAGFGELDAPAFVADWRDFYRPIAAAARDKAQILYEKSALDRAVMDVFDRSFERFSDFFALPITDARLIHGDYNTWNVLLKEDLSHVCGVIDPFGCRWADPEFDLYQLDNANGKMYYLHERYRAHRKLSDNYPQKRAFYELYCELNHFYDASIPLAHSNIPAQAEILASFL